MVGIVKIIKRIVLCIFLMLFIFLSNITYASTKLVGIENFPASYQPYLQELQKKYPSWQFTALYTGLDWDYTISNEIEYGKNLVPKNYSDLWKNTEPGIYDVEVDAGWVNASKRAVEYTMDPRNFLNEVRMFQFESLSYDQSTHTKSGVEKVLYGTEFYDRLVSYKDSYQNIINMGVKYSDLIMNAAEFSNVSSYHLASRIKQEVGPFLSHSSISGTVAGYEGYYNFYNIGATSSAEPLGAIKNGLQYSKDGKGASEEIKSKYLLPWTNPEVAIKGGATFIGSSYISVGQNNLYLQKFDVNDDRDSNLFWHQYMTNCLAPYSESQGIYNAYNNSGLLNTPMTFIIPVYNNMPEYPADSPNILSSDFVSDNTKVYADVIGNLNVRNGPGTSYEAIGTVTSNDVLTRIAKGVQAGERWDKVLLPNGVVGYVFQSYIKESAKPKIEQIVLNTDKLTINKGTITSINATIFPEEAKDNKIIWESSDINIATVDNGIVTAISSGIVKISAKSEDGSVKGDIYINVYVPVTDIQLLKEEITILKGKTVNLNASVLPEDATEKGLIYESANPDIVSIDVNGKAIANEVGETIITVKSSSDISRYKECIVIVKELSEDEDIVIDESLRINDDFISNINLNFYGADDIKSLITTNLNVEIYNNKGVLLENNENVGTDSKIVIKDTNNEKVSEYTIIIYGDLNGDGLINSLDVLVLQKHILETKPLVGTFLKAGNTSKNENNPSSLDVLKIQKHILETKFIEQ